MTTLEDKKRLLGGVEYKLLTKPYQKKAHDFLREQGFQEKITLSFPTIIALEEGRIIGLFATHPRKDMILAGPLALEKGRTRLAIRLVDAYDNVLRMAGVTKYVFFTEQGSKLTDYLERIYGMTPYAVSQGRAFYIKEL